MMEEEEQESPKAVKDCHMKLLLNNCVDKSYFVESGYGSYTNNSSRPLSKCSSFSGISTSSLKEPPPTPTTATLNNFVALHLTTPHSQQGDSPHLKRRSNESGQFTPKKQRIRFMDAEGENEENEINKINTPNKQLFCQLEIDKRFPRKASFRDRLRSDPNITNCSPPSPIHGPVSCRKESVATVLNSTFESISSSTPIANPFRAEFYTQKEVEDDFRSKFITKSGNKGKRTKIIRKMQSFSPKKLKAMHSVTCLPVRKDALLGPFSNNTNFNESEEDCLGDHEDIVQPQCCSSEVPNLNLLLHGKIKLVTPSNVEELKVPIEIPEPSGCLIDVYVEKLSCLDETSGAPVPVESFFDELSRRNVDESVELVPRPTMLHHIDSMDLLIETIRSTPIKTCDSREIQKLSCKRRLSAQRSPSILSTPKKMRRSTSFQMAVEIEKHQILHPPQLTSPPKSRAKKARKRLNYRETPSPAKKRLNYGLKVPTSHTSLLNISRPCLAGTTKLNIFKHMAQYPPVLDCLLSFLSGQDLVRVYMVSKLCQRLIEDNPRFFELRNQCLRKSLLNRENIYGEQCLQSSTEAREMYRFPLQDKNVHIASPIEESVGISPSRKRFQENQKVIRDNPNAALTPCPRCRSPSIISLNHLRVDEKRRRCSVPLCEEYIHSPMFWKQISLPESTTPKVFAGKASVPVAICQNGSCGIHFCTRCKYEFQLGHECVEIDPMSPIRLERTIRQQRRTLACSKQSKRNLKRL